MTSTFIILLFSQVALLLQGLPRAVSLQSPSVEATKLGCPVDTDIAPCICSVDSATAEINMDCSAVLGESELKRIFATDFLFPDLHKLVIQGTEIDPVPIQTLEADTFGKVSFNHVVISNTDLRSVASSAFANSFPTIETMDVSNNRIPFFPFEILAQCEKLTTLDIRNNVLEHVSLLHSNSLRFFDASGNVGLKYEDEVFQTAPMLEVINLSNTNLGHIAPLTFAYQQRLTTLDLQGNSIDYLYANALKFMSSTPTTVNLDNNRIGTVEKDAITGLAAGSILQLKNNMLTDLPQDVWEDIFILLQGTATIELDANLIECACNIKWLVGNSVYMDTLGDGKECDDMTSIHDPAEAEYLGMQAGVTAGTVLAVLLPVLIALLCYASYVRNKQRADFPEDAVRRGHGTRRSFNQFFPRSKRDSSPEPRPGRTVDLRAGDTSPGLKHDDTQV